MLATILLSVAACSRSVVEVTETVRLPAEIAEQCGETDYTLARSIDDPAELTEIPVQLVSSLRYPREFFDAHGVLGTSRALNLCALAEGPLLPGDSVVRFVREPPWPWMGRTYMIRLEARGSRTALAARVLALCRHDSLQASARREFDEASGDTVIYMPNHVPPGSIDYEEVRAVPRELFNDVTRSLEEQGFWAWEDPLPGPDGYSNYVEVQLGNRYKKFEVRAVTGGVPLRLIEEATLERASCGDGIRPPFADWLRDPPPEPRR